MSTRSKLLIAVAAALIVIGAAGMAVAQPLGGSGGDDRPVPPGWMMDGWTGPGGMMAGADADQMQAWMDQMHRDPEMQAWMDQMHGDPERMLELHEEMRSRYPGMQGMMEGFGGARGVDGSHCLGAPPTP